MFQIETFTLRFALTLKGETRLWVWHVCETVFHSVLPAALPAWPPPEVCQDPPWPQPCRWTPAAQTPWRRLWRRPGSEGKTETMTARFHSSATYFQSEEARLLLRSVWVDFDSLAAPELLQLCQPVACLNCTLAIEHRVNQAADPQGKIIWIPRSECCCRNRHITSSNHNTRYYNSIYFSMFWSTKISEIFDT